MSALITVNPDYVRPVISGLWHRAQLVHLPQTGEILTTLCGIEETVEYGSTKEKYGPNLTCWACDDLYRKLNGLPARHI